MLLIKHKLDPWNISIAITEAWIEETVAEDVLPYEHNRRNSRERSI